LSHTEVKTVRFADQSTNSLLISDLVTMIWSLHRVAIHPRLAETEQE